MKLMVTSSSAWWSVVVAPRDGDDGEVMTHVQKDRMSK